MKTILCYGDSNTWGYEPQTDSRISWEERWTGILQKELGNECRIIENGLCGRNTGYDSAAEPFVNGLTLAYPWAVENAPYDLTIIMLGTNDCKDEYGAEPETIAHGIEKIAHIFCEKGGRILIAAPVPMKNLNASPFAKEFGICAEEKSRQLSEYYREMAQNNRFFYIDAGDYAEAGDYDGIHLNRENHKKLGKAIYKKIVTMEEQYER